jgi:farnesyl diphosphate synthase
VRAELVAGLARASGAAGMVGGQCLDLAAEKLPRAQLIAATDVQRLQAMKTGALLRYACEAGAILGHATRDQRQALATYGDKIGLAFQIGDDLLDAEGNEADMGKAVRKDAAKATLHGVLDVMAAKARLAELETEAMAALESFGSSAATLREAAGFVARRKR